MISPDPRSKAMVRRLGLHLLNSGATQAEVMADLSVSRTTTWNWSCALRRGARSEDTAAAAPVLSDVARERLPALLERGPVPYGFSDGRWTMARLTIMFEVEFGLCCSTLQVFRLLGDLAPLPNGLPGPMGAPGNRHSGASPRCVSSVLQILQDGN